MKKYSQLQIVFILTPFVFSFAFGLDIYIPIIPQMTHIFNTTPALIQLTLSLFLFFTGVGQLLIGPLADRFGRKPMFYLSSVCFSIGSLGSALSDGITALIISRIVTSIGACGMLVTAFALVRDLYSNEESAKMYSLLNGAIGISPTFAPILGGYLYLYFGWTSVFFFLTCIGIVAFFVSNRFIHETLPVQNRITLDASLFKRYVEVICHPQFRVYGCLGALSEAVFFCFFSISPFIIIDLHGVLPHQFGYYFALFGCVIALGGIASGKLIEKIGVLATLKTGICLMFIGGASMLAWHMMAAASLTGFLLPMVISCTGAMFLVGGATSAALEPFEACAGTASAAFGALQFSVSSIVGSLLMLFPTSSTVPYGICIVLLASLTAVLFSLRPTAAHEDFSL